MTKMLKKMVKNSNQALFIGLHLFSYQKRQALYSVYAYVHHLNDIIISPRSKKEKLELLSAWQKEIERIFAGEKVVPHSEIGRAIKRNLQPYGVLKSDFASLLESKKQYLKSDLVNFGWDDYQIYCYNECGAFISSVLRILGCHNENLITELSHSLGVALQTTVVLRDVKDNAGSGKLYMPYSCLENAGIKEHNPYLVLADNNLALARSELSQTAVQAFSKSFVLISQLNKKVAARLKSMVYMYKYCFDVMEKRGWEVISPKPEPSCFTKVRLICKAYWGN